MVPVDSSFCAGPDLFPQTLYVADGWDTEQAFVLAIEIRRIAIPHAIGSTGRIQGFTNELLVSLAGKYQKTVAQVILGWLTQRGVVAIHKSVRKERIVENFNVFDFQLSPEDMAAIASLDTKTSSFFDMKCFR